MSVCVCAFTFVCRPYSKPVGGGRDSGMETSDPSMGSGLRKGLRQRSFFEDEYSTGPGEVCVHV